tara:strand:- start:4229 stop:4660 length:432 start_codon:yes stop_codon:yes gene_type:complete
MYITEPNGRDRQIPFSGNIRDIRIAELELEITDIKDMLQMNERELKDKLYIAMRAMVTGSEGGNRNRGRRYNNQYMCKEMYRQSYAQDYAREPVRDQTDNSEPVTYKNKNIPKPMPDFSGVFKNSTVKNHTDNPSCGLVWKDE